MEKSIVFKKGNYVKKFKQSEEIFMFNEVKYLKGDYNVKYFDNLNSKILIKIKNIFYENKMMKKM